MGKSKELMIMDFDEEIFRKTPQLAPNYANKNSGGTYGLINHDSSETGLSDQESRRRLRRNKKRKFEYQ